MDFYTLIRTFAYKNTKTNKNKNMRKIIVTVAPVCHVGKVIPDDVKNPLTPEEIAEDYEAATGRLIARTFRHLDPMETPAVLVKSHGPFCWGKDAAEAVYHARVLEEVALMARLTLELNPETVFQKELEDKHYARKHGPAAYYGQGNYHRKGKAEDHGNESIVPGSCSHRQDCPDVQGTVSWKERCSRGGY